MVESAGRALAEVAVAGGETRAIDLALPGSDEVTLRPDGPGWGQGNLIFLRLQVRDPAALPARAAGLR